MNKTEAQKILSENGTRTIDGKIDKNVVKQAKEALVAAKKKQFEYKFGIELKTSKEIPADVVERIGEKIFMKLTGNTWIDDMLEDFDIQSMDPIK